MIGHPAKFSRSILETIRESWPSFGVGPILDPFAGSGRVHDLADSLGLESVGVEIEPEWAALHPRTIVGDATKLPHRNASFGSVITSPCYGNRMAQNYESRSPCKLCAGNGCSKCKWLGVSLRHTYRHYLGRPVSEGSAGKLLWGGEYRDLHVRAWEEVARVLRPAGAFVLNVSDHIRNGERVRVADWHRDTVLEMTARNGAPCFRLEDEIKVKTPRHRFGANHLLRVEHEMVYIFQRTGA